jgi:hypothetical protein
MAKSKIVSISARAAFLLRLSGARSGRSFSASAATAARLAGPGGARSVVAESVLVKHQLLILNRSRKRAPNLRASDRVVAGLCALFMRPGPVDPFRDRPETVNAVEPPSGADPAEVSPALLVQGAIPSSNA